MKQTVKITYRSGDVEGCVEFTCGDLDSALAYALMGLSQPRICQVVAGTVMNLEEWGAFIEPKSKGLQEMIQGAAKVENEWWEYDNNLALERVQEREEHLKRVDAAKELLEKKK